MSLTDISKIFYRLICDQKFNGQMMTEILGHLKKKKTLIKTNVIPIVSFKRK